MSRLNRVFSSAVVSVLVAHSCLGQGALQPQAPASDGEAQKRTDPAVRVRSFVAEVVGSVQTLRLPENRIHAAVEIARAVWNRDAERARKLFREATNDLIALQSASSADDMELQTARQTVQALRQEIFQALINSDAKLALEFLRSTRPPGLESVNTRNLETELELQAANALASTDPAVALAVAEESLSKGLFSGLFNTVNMLLQKDRGAAGKLAGDIAQKLSVEDLLGNSQNPWLAQNLADQLMRASSTQGSTSASQDDGPANSGEASTLLDAPIRQLTEVLARAALKGDISPYAANQTERAAATNMLRWLNDRTALVGKYAPGVLPDLQKKLRQFQLVSGQAAADPRLAQFLESAAPSAIVRAAADAPANQRDNYYSRAIAKAMGQADFDQAAQIIENNITDPDARDRYLENLCMNLMNKGKADEAEALASDRISNPAIRRNALSNIRNAKVLDDLQKGKLDEALGVASRLPLEQQVQRFVEIADALIEKGKKDLAGQILERAWNLLPGRADNAAQLQAQLNVAVAFAPLDAAKATACMQSIISQLNQMVAGAQAINGFEVHYFKNDELMMGSGLLSSLLAQCGHALADMAAENFDAAKSLSEEISRPDARLIVQLTMAPQLLQNLPSS